MPKPPLKRQWADLANDITDTLLAGHKEYRPDLPYPESHSDMDGAVRALLRRFEVKPRLIPLDRMEMLQDERICVVCGKTDNTVWTSLRLRRDENGSEILAHVDCVVRPK